MGTNTDIFLLRLRSLTLTKSGGGEIRTHGPLSETPVFKTGAFNRSATPPLFIRNYCFYAFGGSARGGQPLSHPSISRPPLADSIKKLFFAFAREAFASR